MSDKPAATFNELVKQAKSPPRDILRDRSESDVYYDGAWVMSWVSAADAAMDVAITDKENSYLKRWKEVLTNYRKLTQYKEAIANVDPLRNAFLDAASSLQAGGTVSPIKPPIPVESVSKAAQGGSLS